MFNSPAFSLMSLDELEYSSMWEVDDQKSYIEPILKAHLIIEAVLEKLIEARLKHPKAILGMQLQFRFKQELAYALGALPGEYHECVKALNEMRNGFAHRLKIADDFDIGKLNSLKSVWSPQRREQFKNMRKDDHVEVVKFAMGLTIEAFFQLLRAPITPPPSVAAPTPSN